tara:strand:+ start:286 stop:621 length:336 start_codon:yes stop_codon:yes gene_type:complete
VTKKDKIEDDKIVPQAEIIIPPSIKLLKLLVTVLACVMIIGFIIIVSLFVLNFQKSHVSIPVTLELQNGVKPIAYTKTKDWYAIVTDEHEILIYDNSGNRIQKIKVNYNSP